MKKDSTPETELLDKIFGLDREEEPLSAHETLEGGRTLREIKTGKSSRRHLKEISIDERAFEIYVRLKGKKS